MALWAEPVDWVLVKVAEAEEQTQQPFGNSNIEWDLYFDGDKVMHLDSVQ